MKEA
jgi:intraflagellar transport protein 140